MSASPPASSGKIVIEDVGKVYPGSRGQQPVEAIDNVDLSADPGEFVSIIGPSGCGKSTLLYIAGGFLEPTRGRVLMNDEEVRGPSPQRGIVFQDYSLFPWLTALGNVTYGLKEMGVSKEEREAQGKELLDTVGLATAKSQYPKQLSGGMRQRLAIARTLAVDSRVLLLDEPMGSLDALTRSTLQDAVADIWQNTGKTILLVTHSVDEAIYLSNRIYVLSGRPSRVLDVLDVDLPRPRNRGEILHSPEYAGIHAHVWELLSAENGIAAPTWGPGINS